MALHADDVRAVDRQQKRRILDESTERVVDLNDITRIAHRYNLDVQITIRPISIKGLTDVEVSLETFDKTKLIKVNGRRPEFASESIGSIVHKAIREAMASGAARWGWE